MTRRISRGFVPAALTAARQARGWTIAQLAVAANIGATSLHRWESGQGAPSIDKLRAVLEALRPGEARYLVGEVLQVPIENRLPSDWRALSLFTLAEIAEQAGVTAQMVGRIERGQVWPTDLRDAERIAEALGITRSELRESFERARADAVAD